MESKFCILNLTYKMRLAEIGKQETLKSHASQTKINKLIKTQTIHK